VPRSELGRSASTSTSGALYARRTMKITPVERHLRTGERVELRSPDVAEAPELLSYIRALASEASRNLNHPPEFFEAITEEGEAAFLEACATHPKSFLLAAYVDGHVVGTTNLTAASATFSPHCGELGLGVLASHRRKGVGRLLMEALIENAEKVGVDNLLLRVRAFNAPAIALYEALAFRRVGILYRVARLPDGFADEYLYQRAPSS
jgi:ribosomal protein S18 acetylase RimI-like enzyme